MTQEWKNNNKRDETCHFKFFFFFINFLFLFLNLKWKFSFVINQIKK